MFEGNNKGSKIKLTPYLAMAWEGVFNLLQWADPVFTPDDVAIWPIAKSEANALGASSEAVLNTLPVANRKKLEKWLNKNLPLVMLTVTIASVAGPRGKYSLDVKKAKRRAITATSKGANQVGTAQGAPSQTSANVRPPTISGYESTPTDDSVTTIESALVSP